VRPQNTALFTANPNQPNFLKEFSMSDEKKCPACGSPVDESETNCSSCDSPLSNSRNAPTILASAPPPFSRFSSGAEALDEIKQLIRDGEKLEAIKVHRDYFKTSLQESQDAVDILASDMPYQPAPVRPRVEAAAPQPQTRTTSPELPQPKSDDWKKWLIGCSIGLVLFCCLCLILVAALGLAPFLGI
jgi:hypothetical protein